MEERTYNGWSNYETWAVSLWLDNDATSYHYWRGELQRHKRCASADPRVQAGTWTAEEAARFNLADQLKDEVTDAAPLEGATVYADLLNAALGEVNWQEIVDAWMTE